MKTFRSLFAAGLLGLTRTGDHLLKAVLCLLLVFALIAPMPAVAQPAYPTNNPTYIPTAVIAASTLTATGDVYFTANGLSGASVRISALSGTLVATIQGSNDPMAVANGSANWSTLYYLNLASPSTAPANSITANGLYGFNTGGFTRFRVHVTTLSGGSHTVTINVAGTPGPVGVYVLNAPAATIGTALPAGTNTIGNVNQTSDLPVGATAVTASTTGTTAATTATLTPSSGKTIWLCGFSIRANATAAATGNATVTGTITGTLNFTQFTAPLASGIGIVEPNLGKCVPGSAADQAVAVVSAAPGSGGVVSVSAWGYEK